MSVTGFRVSEVFITGPPRWGMARRWIVQDGPDAHYKQMAGPFTSRWTALDVLAELVNEHYAALNEQSDA